MSTRDLGIEQLRQLTKPGRAYMWELFIPNVPGGGDAEFIRLHAKNVMLPGYTNEPIEIHHKAHKIKVPGRGPFTQTMTFQLEESEEGNAMDLLINWRDLCVNPETGATAADDTYTTDIYLSLLTTEGVEYRRMKIVRAWPQEISDVTLDYTMSDTIKIDVTMSYDYWVKDL
jgi:hypothetical protein